MHGFAQAGSLDFLIGQEVLQVCFGTGQVQIHCRSSVSIVAEQRITHRSRNPDVTQEWEGLDWSDGTQLTRLLASRITSVKVVSNDTLRISFDNGDELDIYQDDSPYEACQIHGGPDGLIVV